MITSNENDPGKLSKQAFATGPSKDHFIDPHWFEVDIERVFRPRWHFAGHVDELSEAGAFITYRLVDDEIFITRRADKSLVAYYNVCPHRAYPIVKGERGTVRGAFTCQYHGWGFSKDTGKCLHATRMPEGTDPGQWQLSSAWVEEFHGLIFVSFAKERPEPVANLTAGLVTEKDGVGGYDLGRMKMAASKDIEIGANWKVVCENDHECYHCALNHPELAEYYGGGDPFTGFTVVEDLANPPRLFSEDEWSLIEVGGSQSPPVCKVPSPRLPGHEIASPPDWQLFWQPSGHIIVLRDFAWVWSIRPVSPEKTILTQYWLVAETAEEGRDYDVEELKALLDTTMIQDGDLCENVQKGMHMSAYQPGPLNPHHQSPAAHFYHWYERCIAGAPVKA